MFQKPIYRLRRKAAACAVCAVTLLTPALAAGFTDVPQNAWYASAVNEVVEPGSSPAPAPRPFSQTVK